MTDPRPLEVLLVEDNPGDARYIRELLRGATELSERAIGSHDGGGAQAVATHSSAEPTLRHETRLADGIEALAEDEPDVVLLDLGLPDSDGLDTLAAVLAETEAIPVVVLTGLADQERGLEALRQGAEEYLVKDEISADLLVRSVYHAIERKAQQRSLERQRERLAALNQLNGVVQGIIDAVIEQSTREEIERTVCEQLAAAPAYAFAWIGEVDATSDEIRVRTEAGDEGYLDDVTVTVDPNDPHGQGPAGEAVRTGEVQVVSDVQSDSTFDPWRDSAEEYGYRSSAAIPITHEGTLYGVLNVYAARPHAFAGEERDVVGQIGEIVGHAIAAVERKRALMSDDVTEVDLYLGNVLADAPAATELTDRITFERAVPVGDEYRVYGRAHPDDVATVEALVDAVDHWTAVDVVVADDQQTTFELHTDGPPVLTTVASHGGDVVSATIEDGDFRLTTQLPHSATVRTLVESVAERYPEVEVQAQRLVERTDDQSERVTRAFEELLTDRQRAILETAYFRGYFEWPRESTGAEIAESLDLAQPTFSEHLRGAKNRIFEALFEGAEESADE